jgi:ammonium transporter, Amt family
MSQISECELREKNAALENISREKTRWLLAAAHDLRNRLSAIQSYAELAIEEAADCIAPEQKNLVESIHASTESMLQLLSDLMEIASAEDGSARLQFARTALTPLIEESVSLCRPMAQRKGTGLNLTRRKPLPVVLIDPERIRHVFIRLIESAIKHSQAGATVEVDAVAGEREVLISVRDNGPGIPPDELHSIFAPFQKTRARAASSEPGTGLDLAICKRTVEDHGGRIWAESTFGEGATFHVALKCEGLRTIARSREES